MPMFSRYNHFLPWQNGSWLAYNARSGAVALMDKKQYAAFGDLSQKMIEGKMDNLTQAERELLLQLQYGFFVHVDDFSELDWLNFEHLRARYAETVLALAVAPTLACNMACTYCFEGDKRGRMSTTVAQDLIEFIKKRSQRIRLLDVTWYGGEPLLALDIIKEFTSKVIDLSSQCGFQYVSMMITNGYLLSADVVDRLVELKCTGVQVTLDGPPQMHDKRRPLKNGLGTFRTIIQNLKYASAKMAVSIRVNIDKSSSIEMIRQLLAELKVANLESRIGINYAMVEASTAACAGIADSCYGSIDFAKVEAEYYSLLLSEGFFIGKLPVPNNSYCIAQQINSFVVDPDGDLYRCFAYVGDKSKSMGKISDDINYQHPEFTRLFRFDPFVDEACRACSILPLCMGSCPAKRVDRQVSRELICSSWKYNLEPMLKIIALSRLQQMQQVAVAAKEEV